MIKSKWLFLLILLSITVFLKSCSNECGGEDFSTHTFSIGFIFPYFDIAICTVWEPVVTFPYNTFLAISINLLFIFIGLLIISKINLVKWNKSLSKLALSLFINIIIFDLSLFRQDCKFIEWLYTYYIYTPILGMFKLLERTRLINLGELNLLSRIYFAITVIVLYFVITISKFIWRKIRRISLYG